MSARAPPGHAWVNATVHPMGFATRARPAWQVQAQAVLWTADRLRLVGTTGEIRAESRRLGIEPVDLDGRVVVPGFVDAHTHFLHVGVKATRPDLRGAKTRAEALRRLADWLSTHPGSTPIIGEGWDESEWPDRQRPSRDELDGVIAQAASNGFGPPDRPVVLRRICGHVAVASSGALPRVRARWDDDAAVDRGSGLLLEAPSLYLNEVLPSSPEQLDQAVQRACHEAHLLGVTAVGDYSQAPYRMALQRAAARGTLTVRTFSSIYVQQLAAERAAGFRTGRPGLGPADLTPAARQRLGLDAAHPQGTVAHEHVGAVPGTDGGDRDPGGTTAWLRDGGLKVFLDGSLGGRTAHLREPYLDDAAKDRPDPHAGHDHGSAGPYGSRIWSDADVDQHFGAAHAGSIQVHAHAIGDAAIDQGLEAFERLAARDDLEGRGWLAEPAPPEQLHEPDEPYDAAPAPTGPQAQQRSLRHRFEHYEIVHDDQVRRTVALGIVSSSQPNFVGEWSAKGGMYEARLGARFGLNNRFRDFKQAGLALAFGSDGMPFGPLVGLQAAVNHPDPEQRLAPAEAIWHYTSAAAWAIHWEDSLGCLRPGFVADLVALQTRDLNGAPARWGIHQTVTGGHLRVPDGR